MEEMTTITQVIDKLKKDGYVEDFNLCHNCVKSEGEHFSLFPDDFIIDNTYRFEGDSDPADEATVYAISAKQGNIKGILVNGAGIYTDELTDEMLELLKINRK